MEYYSSVVLQHLVHVGLNDLEVFGSKYLATAILKQVEDLEHDVVASFLPSGGVGHGVTPVSLDLHCGIADAKTVT